MRILVVSQYFAPENFRVNDLVAGLTDRGHEVTVLTGQPNYPGGAFFPGYGWRGPRQERFFGATVVRVPLIRRAGGGGLRLVLNYFSFVVTASWAARCKLHGPFDAVIVFETSPVTVGIPAAVASRRFKAPVLFWILDLWPDSLVATGAIRSPAVLAGVGRMVRWIYAQCALILVQSKAFPERVVCHGVPPERIRYFPNWVEPEYMASPSLLPSERAHRPGLRIVYAGNIGAAQGFDRIIEAAAMLHARGRATVTWTIAGDGRAAEWARGEVAARGLGAVVEFLGQLPSSRMPALFAEADVLLVSLSADPLFARTIPGKVQSYMASGRPVLAMLDGEGARIIEEARAGLVCAAGDAAGLVKNVETLLDMPVAQREAMGAQGRQYAMTEFSREGLFDRLESWLSSVTSERVRNSKHEP